MQIGCPNCGQGLFVRDGLRNPTCRCPACRQVFRAVDHGYVPGLTGGSEPLSPAVRTGNPQRNPTAADLAEARDPFLRPIPTPSNELTPTETAELTSLPPPEKFAPGPASPAQPPKKITIGTIIFVALIVLKVASKFFRPGAPLPKNEQRNVPRNAIPAVMLRSIFEQPPIPIAFRESR